MLHSGNYVYHGGPSLIVLCGFFLLVFSIVKYYYKLAFLRVKTPKRAWEAVFNVRGPVTTYIEVRWGGGGRANLAVLSLWLFRTVRLLNLS